MNRVIKIKTIKEQRIEAGLMTLSDMAREIGVNIKSLHRWMAYRRIDAPSYQWGSGVSRYYHRDDVSRIKQQVQNL